MVVTPIQIHHVHANVLIAEKAIVEGEIGDFLAVRRYSRRLVRPCAPGQRSYGAVRNRHLVDLSRDRITLPPVRPVATQQDTLAISSPCNRTLLIEGAKRELPRKATFRRDYE